MNPFWAVAIAFSTLLVGLRLGGLRHEAFQAVFHLWLGAMSYAWLVNKSVMAKAIVFTILVVEIFAFTMSKLFH